METSHNLPTVIPMWLTGYERLMPEGREFPYKYLPRFGTNLGVAFGDPIPPDLLADAMTCQPDGMDEARIRVTMLLHDRVEDLGRTISDNPSRLTTN